MEGAGGQSHELSLGPAGEDTDRCANGAPLAAHPGKASNTP